MAGIEDGATPRATDFHPLTRRALPGRTLAGLALAMVTVALITLFTYRALAARELAAERLRTSENVVEQLNAAMAAVRIAETSERGFLLTGDARHLAPFAGAKAELRAALEALRRMLPAGSAQAERLELLAPEALRRMDELDRIIQRYRSGEVAGAIGMVGSQEGQAAMEQIRAAVSAMDAEERRGQAIRQTEWQEAVDFSNRVTWSGSAVLVFLILVAAWLLSRDHRARETQIWLRTRAVGARARGCRATSGSRRSADSVLGSWPSTSDAQVGAVYLADGGGRFRRFAGYALPPCAPADGSTTPATGLLGAGGAGPTRPCTSPTCRRATSPCRRASAAASAGASCC